MNKIEVLIIRFNKFVETSQVFLNFSFNNASL